MAGAGHAGRHAGRWKRLGRAGTPEALPSASVPADAENRWRSIIAEVRAHYKGPLWWAWPYTPGNLASMPGFIFETDSLYLLWQAPLATSSETPRDQITAQAGRLLDEEVAVLQNAYKKPIVLGLAFPSTTTAGTACLPDLQGRCLEWTVLSRPNPDYPSLILSLQRQADLYQAMLEAVNTRPWVGGVVSRGYYPPALLQDKSASVHGKPAADILWYWFPRLLGITR
jgi:hypothetical protein